MGIFFLKYQTSFTPFCKVISYPLNTKTGFQKGKKGSINKRKTVLKNKENKNPDYVINADETLLLLSNF